MIYDAHSLASYFEFLESLNSTLFYHHVLKTLLFSRKPSKKYPRRTPTKTPNNAPARTTNTPSRNNPAAARNNDANTNSLTRNDKHSVNNNKREKEPISPVYITS